MFITVTWLLVCLCCLSIICLILHRTSFTLWTSVNPRHVPGYLQYVLPSKSSMEIQSSVGPTSDQSSRTCQKQIYEFLWTKFILQSFLEKLIFVQLGMKFPACNETAVFVTLFTRPTSSRHYKPGEPLHIFPSHVLRHILMCSSHLHSGLGLQRGASLWIWN